MCHFYLYILDTQILNCGVCCAILAARRLSVGCRLHSSVKAPYVEKEVAAIVFVRMKCTSVVFTFFISYLTIKAGRISVVTLLLIPAERT